MVQLALLERKKIEKKKEVWKQLKYGKKYNRNTA
jgi:hypothetical protein